MASGLNGIIERRKPQIKTVETPVLNYVWGSNSRRLQIAERFGNSQTSANLNQSQMVEMLALPAGEEEKFIEQKAAKINKKFSFTINYY